jgi:hypothetical protein
LHPPRRQFVAVRRLPALKKDKLAIVRVEGKLLSSYVTTGQ